MKNIKYLQGKYIASFRILKQLHIFVLISFVAACDDFIEVDLPKNQLLAEVVFEDSATATAALRSIYAKMRGNTIPSTLTSSMGLYADELDQYSTQNSFYDHTLLAINDSGWWDSTYNLIYAANAVIEGVNNSTALSLEDQNQFLGEALFIRAYLHFNLVNLYGSIPFIDTTNYIVNTTVSRIPVNEVYNLIIDDLLEASSLLGTDVSESPEQKIRIYGAVAQAMLARVYLYMEQWSDAESRASEVINSFVLEPDLDKVFLKNASGTIWQFKPFPEGSNTIDARSFIFTGQPLSVALSESLFNAFETNDRRVSKWIGTTTSTSGGITSTWYYAFKYKVVGNEGSVEYPINFRLAEQYLIRAEARVRRDDIDILGAQSDLNVIRNRAGLPNNTTTNADDLLGAILKERQTELFTEQGHRWFDLKRTRKAAEVLAPIKPGWRNTDVLLPIPESEILLNPNLLPQNDGY